MKLIHCASGRMESDWAEGVPPPYAILSHTWAQPRDGSPGEVTYQDYVTGRKASPSRNWEKIDRAIQITIEDGLEYIWIDSCCIDKTSSAELSEAINSMFQWYSAAAVCYAYLEDYDKEAKGKLASCKWFYRGWTLQELIAPARVEFYDKDWKNLGSRQSLSDAIADITNVDREILLADSVEATSRLLYQAPIAKRFSWASKRATTRPEDLAYCLLGIFQVNMPLLYGEGRRAFIRLQKEIMKDSDDLTIFAWQAPPGYKESMSEFRGILATSADEFSLPAEVMRTHAAGFNPSFEVTNKGLKIDVPLKTTANSEDMWMSLNCRYGFEHATLGVLLRYQGANRYIRSKPQVLEFESPGEWTRPGQIFIILDTAVAITTILEPSAVHQNSFAFSLNEYRLQMVSVSHPDRWYQPKNTMNTYGEPNFVGCYFFRTRKTLVLLETDIVLAFGVGSRGEPWACLGIGKGRKASAGMQGKVEMNTDLYDAAVEEKWDRVRQLGVTQQIHGIRIYHSVDGRGKWGLFASVAPLEMISKEGIYSVKIGCEPFSDSSFAPGLKGALKPTDLHIHLIDTVSRSTLTQTFVNPRKAEPVDGIEYVFPLVGGVAVVAFTCTLANRTINGVVKERERARLDYLAAKSQGKTAALVQQSLRASDVWKASIGNVPAGGTIIVKIIYLSELKHDAEINGVRLTIPTHIASRYGNQKGVEGTGSTVEEEGLCITLDAEMPPGSSIITVQSPSHPTSVNIGKISIDKKSQPCLSRASAVLSTPLTGFIDRDCVFEVVATSLGEPVAFVETHASLPYQRALMATLVPKFDLPADKPEIVFLFDRSGSMKGKIPALVASLNIFLESLPLGVKFNICSFGTSFEFLWPRSCTYSQDTLSQAVAYVQGFGANCGGTEMYQPTKAVFEQRYKDMSLAVFLLTDGKVWDQRRLFDLISNEVGKPDANARAFTLGVGSGASTSLIEGAAQAGKGFAQAVLKSEKMGKKVIRMLKAALLPQISDYSLDITYQDTSALPEDDFVVIEKDMESLNRLAAEEEKKVNPVISLYNKGLESEDLSGDDSGPTTVDAKYDHLPPVDVPACIQTPTEIPPLYPFNRTTIYVLLPTFPPERKPKSVLLKATCSHGPLEVEIPIVHLLEPSTTIHQLAARREMKELEEGRGWLAKAKNAEGELLRTKHDGRFSDMVEREAVRIGTRFQVAGKWTSFVAVEESPDGTEQPVAVEGFSQSQHAEPAPKSTMSLNIPTHSKKKKARMSCCFVADYDYGHENREAETDDDLAELEVMKMAGRPLRRNVNAQQHMIDRITQKSDAVDDAVKMNRERLDRIGDGPVSREQKTHSSTPFQTLASLQQFSGNWKWSQELGTVLSFDIQGTTKTALLKSVDNGTDTETIIATACAVTFLKKRLAADKELWEMLADKAETWLRGKVGENVEEFFKAVEKAMGF